MSENKEGTEGSTPSQEGTEGSANLDELFNLTKENAEKIGKFESLIGNWSNEVGSTRQELAELKELLQTQRVNDDYDPYNQEQIVNLISKTVEEKQQNWIQNQFMPMVQTAAETNQVKDEFKLNAEELQQVQKQAQENGYPVRAVAFELFGERKFKQTKPNLTNELKQNDVAPPLQTSADANTDLGGIPQDPEARAKWFRETPKEVRQAMIAKVGAQKG